METACCPAPRKRLAWILLLLRSSPPRLQHKMLDRTAAAIPRTCEPGRGGPAAPPAHRTGAQRGRRARPSRNRNHPVDGGESHPGRPDRRNQHGEHHCAMYATGMSPAEMREFAEKIDWDDAFLPSRLSAISPIAASRIAATF